MPSLQRGPFSSWVKWRMVKSGYSFFLFCRTNRPNAAFESSNFCSLPTALLSQNHNKPLPLMIQTHGYDEHFHEALGATFKMQIHKRLTWNVDCLALPLHELPPRPFSARWWSCYFTFRFLKRWPPRAKRMSSQQSAEQRQFHKPFKAVISVVLTCSCEEQWFRWEVM